MRALVVDGPEDASDPAGADPEALGSLSGISDCACRACSLSFPPRMKNDDEIYNIRKHETTKPVRK